MNIIEGNKLIAEFMGYKYYPFDYELKNKNGLNRWGWRKNSPSLPTGNVKINIGKTHYLGRKHRDLKFHEDWNWLIDVINYIKQKENSKDIVESLKTINIERVWGYVVEYVENQG